jgi:hypothetical protein
MKPSHDDDSVSRQPAERNAPPTVHEVVRLINEPRTSVARLAAAVAKHHALAESVLRKANSSGYGFRNRVTSLSSAVVVLGFDRLRETLRNMLMATTGRSVVRMVMRQQKLWEHSIGCAIAAQTLARASGTCPPDDAFTAGLLHEVGSLFAQPEDGERLTDEQWSADRVMSWGMPEDIVEAIRCIHEPQQAKHNPSLAGIVHLADVLCDQWGVGATHPVGEHQNGDGAREHTDAPDAIHLPGLENAQVYIDVIKAVTAGLIEAIDGLREEERMVVALYYFEGLSLDVIGQLLEIPASRAAVDLKSALGQLHAALQAHI